jgi:hypothetical protein
MRKAFGLNLLLNFTSFKKTLLLLPALLLTVAGLAQSWQQRGSDITGKANLEGIGNSSSLSQDGKVLAIGAASANSLNGLARVYEWSGSAWAQKGADLKGATGTQDQLGFSVSLDSSGKTLAVGAPYADASFGQYSNSGYVKIYSWSGSAWVQKGSTLAAAASGENCGYSLSLSNDGNTLAIGAAGSAGGGTSRGQTRIYTWSGTAWVQKGSNINGEEDLSAAGNSVSLDGSGNYVAIGAPLNGGSSGTNSSAGQVRVYKWSGTAWAQLGSDIDGDAADDIFGNSVCISKNGKRLIAGAPRDFMGGYGYAKIYDWSGSAWVQKGSNITSAIDGDEFGYNVSISGSGDYIAAGARNGATGNEKGRAEVYSWSGLAWQLQGSAVKGKENDDKTGHSLSLNYDGTVFVVTSPNYNGSGTALGNVQVYRFTGACTPTNSTTTVSACGTYTWNSKKYTSSGTYMDTIQNAEGCDSVMTLHLTIFSPKLQTMATAICGSDPYTSPGGKKYNASGTYQDTLKSKSGCDSIIYTITLTKKIPNVDGFVLKDSTIIPVTEGAVAHGDIDKDGDEDILISGKDGGYNLIAEIYTNDGSGNFTKLSGTSFTGARNGSASLVDIDGDNLREVFISGVDNNEKAVSYLYKNNGGGSFTQVTAAPFDNLTGTKHAFADVDKDGHPDLLISTGDSVFLYKNASGSFAGAPFVITNSKADNGFILPADLNGDGYADLIKGGSDFNKGGAPTELFINDKTGKLTKVPDPFEDLSIASGAVADLNYDSKPDFLICGFGKGFKIVTKIYTNDGTGKFTLSDSTSIKGFFYGTAVVEDFTSDGGQEVFMSGSPDFTSPQAKFYLRNSLGKYVFASSLPVPGLQMSAATAFDMDKDGLKDLLITGQDASNEPHAGLYKNKGCFAACETESEMTVKYCKTPYISPSGQAWTESGTYIDVLKGGNATGCDSIITIHLITNSHSSISAVACDSFITPSGKVLRTSGIYSDTLKGGNHLGCDSIISINLKVSTKVKLSVPNFVPVTNSPFTAIYNSQFIVRDLDDDNLPEVFEIGLHDGSGPFIQLFKNNGNNNFTDITGTGFITELNGNAAISDVDGDNKPDIIISGMDVTNLYKNNGDLTFTRITGTSFIGSPYEPVIADMDNDNKPDIFLKNKLYKNNGNNSFTVVQGTPFNGVNRLAVADVNADSKLDIITVEVHYTGGFKMIYETKLYTNQGGNNFSLVSGTPFDGANYDIIKIADIDEDTKPDVLLVGMDNSFQVICKLFKNNGNNGFTQITGVPGVSLRAVQLADIKDIDGDGRPDLFFIGDYEDFSSRLLLNNGNDKFTITEIIPIRGLYSAGGAIDDVDGDGKPDILLSGLTGYSGNDVSFRMYKNISAILSLGTCIAPTGCNTYTSPSGKYTWTKSGVYKDTIHLAGHDSVIVVNLLIDKAVAKFTQKTDPDGKYKLLIVNKSKGTHMSYIWKFGDGDSSTAVTPTHTYQSSGDYDLCLTITTGKGCKSTYCQKISLHGKKDGPYTIAVIDSIDGTSALAIEESPAAGGANLSFNIYPNPANHTLNVVNNESDEYDMVVRDLSGRQVASQQNQRGKSIVDMSALKPGMYFIEIQSKNRVGYYKVLKQ